MYCFFVYLCIPMIQALTSNQFLSRLATLLMVALTGLVITQPHIAGVAFLVDYVEWFTIGITCFGLLMVALNQKHLMFASMLSAASICLYFDQPEAPIMHPSLTTNIANVGYEIKVGHCNLNNHNGEPGAMVEYMRAQQSDLLTLLEYNAGWDSILDANLSTSYPYKILRSDLGYKGMAIYSRLPIFAHDSIETHDACMYAVRVSMDNQLGDLACYLNMVPLTPGNQSDSNLTPFLDKIKTCINKSTVPSLILGEFSNPNWDNTLRSFRSACNLYNSRVGLMVTSPCAQFPNFRVPSEHIFYTTNLECTEFQAIGNPHSDYIGLTGTYRLKPTNHVSQ
jgi:hypothetical protein